MLYEKGAVNESFIENYIVELHTPADVELWNQAWKNLIDEKSLDDFKAIDYPKIQNLIKHNLIEVNYAGEPSDYRVIQNPGGNL